MWSISPQNGCIFCKSHHHLLGEKDSHLPPSDLLPFERYYRKTKGAFDRTPSHVGERLDFPIENLLVRLVHRTFARAKTTEKTRKRCQ